jgi:hypothetical protein
MYVALKFDINIIVGRPRLCCSSPAKRLDVTIFVARKLASLDSFCNLNIISTWTRCRLQSSQRERRIILRYPREWPRKLLRAVLVSCRKLKTACFVVEHFFQAFSWYIADYGTSFVQLLAVIRKSSHSCGIQHF